MAKTKLDEALENLMKHSPRSFGKVTNQLRRTFDEWALNELARQGYPNFKMAYMPFLMNIGLEGNTNKEIAAKCKVSKQAMSKVVKELVEMNLIKVETHETDKRSATIYLTTKGKQMMFTAKTEVLTLTQQYRKIIGDKNYEVMIDAMLAIIDYHENSHKK